MLWNNAATLKMKKEEEQQQQQQKAQFSGFEIMKKMKKIVK